MSTPGLDKRAACNQDFSMISHWNSLSLAVIVAFSVAGNCAAGKVSDEPGFPAFCYAQNDLGAAYSPQSTTLKLWAPTATRVEAALYANARTEVCSLIPLARTDGGIWSGTIMGNADGNYYLYRVTLPGVAGGNPIETEVNDPYAHGCSANCGRTLIFDPAITNPAGWDQDQFVELKNNTDAVLYELHVRDFTIARNSGVVHRGKYLGLTETGTQTPDGEKSGLEHLQELGITHVHLLPVNAYAGGDERQEADGYTWYDWGYDPVLFAAPAGVYATSADGTARQKEFKRMVQVLHQHHLGVVLDVVFNHTAQTVVSRFLTRSIRAIITAKTGPATTRMPPVAAMKSPRSGPWCGSSSWIRSNIG
jgi:pullulanase